ncbi:MAG: hypothetical protein ABSF53_21965 [Terracidiphilus sp.]
MHSLRISCCFCFVAFASLLAAQTPPTAYTITQGLQGGENGTMTIYRNGSAVLMEYRHAAKPDGTPASHSLSFYDLKAGVSHSWDPSITPPSCSAGTFSGDWGDPFASTKELTDAIAKGDLKAAGAETLNGISTKVHAGTTQGTDLKAWIDEKDGLVVKLQFGALGTPVTTMVDIQKASFTAPAASLFVLPAYCTSVKPPPTAAELVAAETGDSADNFVNAIYGPGSKDSCSIVIRVVAAKTMAPVTRKWQAAIDTTFKMDNPPQYVFGVGTDGTSTFAGGGIHEITSQIHNDMLRIENPPAYFNFAMNVIQPNHGTGSGMIYRQCFAPVTMLYYVLKDPNDVGAGADWLYAKSGKYAAVPAH